MRKMKLFGAVTLASALAVTGCAGGTDNKQTTTATVEATSEPQTETEEETSVSVGPNVTEAEVYIEPRPVNVKDNYILKAKDADVKGNCKLNETGSEAFLDGLSEDGDAMIFKVNVEAGYFFDIIVDAKSSGGDKINYICIDGEQSGSFKTTDNREGNLLQRVYIPEGQHEISITKSWGWINVYGLELRMCDELDASIYDIPATLIDPNADDCAKQLMSYLTDIYGKYTLTGQYNDSNVNKMLTEIGLIDQETGKRPAVWGFDIGQYESGYIAHSSKGAQVDTMIRLHNANPNIIFTVCWHWHSPEEYQIGGEGKEWYSSFRTESSKLKLDKIMNGEDERGYELLMQDIDLIAEQLKLLEDAGIPIIWRPLHEASGGWFWWGAAGADAYKKLYTTMYDKLVNEHGIHNLIWLWNGQNKDWYPGDEYVDIIGEDIYAGNQISTSQAGKFFEANDYTSAKKMVVLSENGCIPDIELCRRDGAMWGFFAVWNGEFVYEKSKLTEKYTSLEILNKVYNSEYAITLDEVPDLTTYPIK